MTCIIRRALRVKKNSIRVKLLGYRGGKYVGVVSPSVVWQPGQEFLVPPTLMEGMEGELAPHDRGTPSALGGELDARGRFVRCGLFKKSDNLLNKNSSRGTGRYLFTHQVPVRAARRWGGVKPTD